MSALPQLAKPTPSAESTQDVAAVDAHTPSAPVLRAPDSAASRRDHTPTLVGHGSEFVGQLHCPGDLTVAGQGEGVAHVEGTFVLSQHASWRGEVYCRHAVLAGQFTGRLHTLGNLEIHASACLRGDLHAGQMSIATGAVVAAAIFMANMPGDARATR